MIAPIYRSPRGLTFDERYGPAPVAKVRVPQRSIMHPATPSIPDVLLSVPIDDVVSVSYSARDVIQLLRKGDWRFEVIEVDFSSVPIELFPMDHLRN